MKNKNFLIYFFAFKECLNQTFKYIGMISLILMIGFLSIFFNIFDDTILNYKITEINLTTKICTYIFTGGLLLLVIYMSAVICLGLIKFFNFAMLNMKTLGEKKYYENLEKMQLKELNAKLPNAKKKKEIKI